MKDILIRWLGGYTRLEAEKIGRREFDDYSDSRRLGGLLPEGAQFKILADGIGGTFLVRQYSDGEDNNGTILKARK